jgi:hypothetical protein
LVAIDGRPTKYDIQPAHPQPDAREQYLVVPIDEVHGRSVANASAASSTATDASLSQTQVTAIDINPASPTFHSVVRTTVFPEFRRGGAGSR